MSHQQAGYPQAGRPGYSLPYAADPSGFGYPQPPDREPIVEQPVGGGALGDPGGWTSFSQGNHNIPHTLRYLTTVDQLLLHKKAKLPEAFDLHETPNVCAIRCSTGEDLYYALTDSDSLSQSCCGPLQPFKMKILDSAMVEVIHLNRPLADPCCCFSSYLQKMEVSSPPGTVIGSIEEASSWCRRTFNINDAAGDVVLKVKQLFCINGCCVGSFGFKVVSRDGGTQVGEITKEWPGCWNDCRGASQFGIMFSRDLDVKMKALMIGACFLIDIIYTEEQRAAAVHGVGVV